MSKGPILIDLDAGKETAAETPSPAEAPPVPDPGLPTADTQLQQMAVLAARPRSALARWFWAALGGLLSLIVGVAIWDFVAGLMARAPLLGTIALAFAGVFCAVLLILSVRELAAFARLRRVDGIRRSAEDATADQSLSAARSVVDQLKTLYKSRPDTQWGRDTLAERGPDILDADTLLGLAEHEVLAPLDAQAATEIEAAARQVATVTALVPLALADLITALAANLRMIRRIAEIYGGRSGVFGSWRLTRAVLSHLVATGAVAIGDDLIGSVAGGGVLSKVSRRFGEGVVNGALTARVGVAAMEVCRPLPFVQEARPSVTALVRRALTGLFGQRD